MSAENAEQTEKDIPRPKPEGLREFSPRSILCGLFVAALMGASYPYVVLKLGFGPNVSVVAAILGYIVLGVLLARLVPLFGLRYRPVGRTNNPAAAFSPIAFSLPSTLTVNCPAAGWADCSSSFAPGTSPSS